MQSTNTNTNTNSNAFLRTLFPIATLLCVALTSQAATRMNVDYRKTCFDPVQKGECAAGESRSLIYTNNPEALTRQDLADSGGTPYSFHTANVNAGRHRSFASHIAASGTVGGNIGYALIFRNTGSRNLSLTIRGKAAIDSCVPNGAGGAEIFTQTFNNYDRAVENYTIAPGASKFLPVTGVAPNYTMSTSSCPNVLVDFDASAALQVQHIAFRDARFINPNFASYVPMSYITGASVLSASAPPEDRYYKGLSPFSAVRFDASTTLSSSDRIGDRIPVRYSDYNGQTQNRDFGPQNKFDRTWWSNINAGGQSGLALTAMGSDVLTFTFTRTFAGQTTTNVFSPTTRDGTRRIHNLGNWGVVYTQSISISNPTANARTVDFMLSPVPNNTFFAATLNHNTVGAIWRSFNWKSGPDIAYATCRIPANTTRTCRGSYVLGGPGSADLIQYVRISQ